MKKDNRNMNKRLKRIALLLFTLTLFTAVISLFTALLITRALLNLAIGMGINDPKKYRSLGRRAK